MHSYNYIVLIKHTCHIELSTSEPLCLVIFHDACEGLVPHKELLGPFPPELLRVVNAVLVQVRVANWLQSYTILLYIQIECTRNLVIHCVLAAFEIDQTYNKQEVSDDQFLDVCLSEVWQSFPSDGFDRF